MNSITFDGRLAADAELRYTPSGEAVLSFRVASDIGFGERKTPRPMAAGLFNAFVDGETDGTRAEVERAHKGASTKVVDLGGKALLPGFEVHFGAACIERGPHGRLQQFGNLIATRLPVQQVQHHSLPWPADPGQPSLRQGPRWFCHGRRCRGPGA